MTQKASIQCPTPRCVQSITKYGESYHSVYAREHGFSCESCGGKSPDGVHWNHFCKRCDIEVQPGELVGLFVPHLCKNCEQEVADEQIKAGKVCGMCRKPYSRCCC